MNRKARRTRGAWIVLTLAAPLTFSVGCGSAAGDAAPKAVRAAAEEYVREFGGEMIFDDPTGSGRLTLAFDHAHDGVRATEGERQVVCVDFKSADGTVYDVDFYVGRSEASDSLLIEEAVIHKVSGKNVLSDARRAELDRKD